MKSENFELFLTEYKKAEIPKYKLKESEYTLEEQLERFKSFSQNSLSVQALEDACNV